MPVGDHGLLTIGHPSTAAVDDFEHTMVEMVEQTMVDALDRVDREAELERRRTELERSNESLQQFAYVASHDLQEPLRMVSSYVSLLDSEYADELDDDATQYMEYAVDGARRMQEMIGALLQYSRVHSRRDDFERGQKGAASSGTGFGLFFISSMVESYGGRVRAEESDAGGAAFVVELPRA